MKYALVVLTLFIASVAQAKGLGAECAAFQAQMDQLGEQRMREMGMGQLIDMCAKEDTASYKEAMQSGTLYCKSGDLCASYDFQYESDREKYKRSCAQVAGCPTENVSDSCSKRGDKVRNGRGTVDWTIYAYNGLVRDSAKNLQCD